MRIVRESLPDTKIIVLRHKPSTIVPELADFVVSDLDAALAFNPQVAIVATPAPFHLDLASVLVSHGCDVLIEKPIATRSDDVIEFSAKARKLGRICQVAYNLRFDSALSEFRRLIRDGVIGRPMSVRCDVAQFLPDWRPNSDYKLGVSACKELGGGVLLELSHEVDYLSWIFGPIAWVSAWSGRVSDLDINVEDFSLLTLGIFSDFSRSEVVASVALDFARRDSVRTCLVAGNEGTLRWDALSGLVDQYSPRDSRWRVVYKRSPLRDHTYKLQLEHFLACVRTRVPPMVSCESGLAVLRVIDAANASSMQGGAMKRVLTTLGG